MYAVRVNVGTALIIFGLIFLVVFTSVASGVSSSFFQYCSRAIENLSSFVVRVHWSGLFHAALDRLAGLGRGENRVLKRDAERRKG